MQKLLRSREPKHCPIDTRLEQLVSGSNEDDLGHGPDTPGKRDAALAFIERHGVAEDDGIEWGSRDETGDLVEAADEHGIVPALENGAPCLSKDPVITETKNA